ncbi:MAG TPA: SPFH domain-containing protein [Polyangiaceae bacterium]|jgi:membrane protease subunit (stomatin/prohibitin family)|nr:SPFH domain-containing protein [Polyangiaceae bacterium]
MGVFDFVRNGVREMMIARPDTLKSLIVYKHPDQNIPMHSQLTVDSDECAVFFRDGRIVGVIPPGRVTLDTQNIPFLNSIVTNYTGGQVFIAEVYFVKTTPVRSVPFGGPIGDMLDPMTGEQVQPRIFGEMSVVVVDPVRFVVGYSGQAAAGDNDAVLGWIKGLFMNGVKTTLGELCDSEGKSLLQAVSLTSKLAAAFVAHAPDLNDIGVRILQVGSFNINFSDTDRQRLVAANAEIAKAQREVRVKQIGVAGAAADAQAKQFGLDQQFGQDSRYVKELAGSYQGYAAGQAIIGAGKGMAEHGVGGGGVAGLGAQMAVGMGMGNVMAGGFAPPVPAPTFSPGGTQVTCGKCGAKQPGGKFCAECGGPLVAQKKFCSGCGVEMGATAKFCSGCGTPAVAPGAAG